MWPSAPLRKGCGSVDKFFKNASKIKALTMKINAILPPIAFRSIPIQMRQETLQPYSWSLTGRASIPPPPQGSSRLRYEGHYHLYWNERIIYLGRHGILIPLSGFWRQRMNLGGWGVITDHHPFSIQTIFHPPAILRMATSAPLSTWRDEDHSSPPQG